MRIDISLQGERLVQQIKAALLKRLTFDDNVESSAVDIPDTGPADSVFVVQHNLGKVPKYYMARLDKAGVVYDYNRDLWTPTQMQLKCSVASASVKLIVF